MRRAPRLCTLGLALWLPCAQVAAGGAIEVPGPDGATQQRISQLIDAIVALNRGQTVDDISSSVEALQQSLDGDRESLLRQIVFYRAATPGNEPAMASALLVEVLDFTVQEKIGALVPLLDSADARVLASTRELLSTIDRPAGAAPDFRAYEAVLRGDERSAAGLIRYLYSVSPVEALESTMRAFVDRSLDVDTATRVLALEGLRSTDGDGTISNATQASDAIAMLSQHDSWCVRLYAAQWIRLQPELASRETLARLRSDPHALVRDATPR